MYPSSQRRSGFWPSSPGPVASHPPLGIGLLRWPRGDPFHLAFSCAGLPRMVAC